jgi:hypothetical protein
MISQSTSQFETLMRVHQWLPDTLEGHFHQLAVEAESYRRDGDDFPKIGFREPYAGKRLFELLEVLRERGRVPPDPDVLARHQQSRAFEARVGREWAQYGDDQDYMSKQLEGKRHVDMIFEFLELQPGDLGPRTDPENPGGRRAGWPDIASRVNTARRRWDATEHKFLIYVIVSINRLTRAFDELNARRAEDDKRITAMEKEIARAQL